MAISSKVGSFQLTTNIGPGTNQAITGVGFQPKIVLFWGSGRIESSDANGRRSQSSLFGFAISSTKQGSVSCLDGDNQSATTSFLAAVSDQNCIGQHGVGNSGYVGTMKLISQDADGFTLQCTTSYVGDPAYTVHYLALGGSDLQVDGGFATPPTTATTLSVSSMSFQPNLVIFGFANNSNGTIPTAVSASSELMLGFASGSGAGQQFVIRGSFENTTVTRSQSYGATGAVFVNGPVNTGSVGTATTKATFTSFNSNGWTISFNPNALTSAFESLMWIAIKATSAVVGATTTAAVTGNFSKTGLGFQPTVAMLFSHCLAQSSGTTTQLGDARSIGAFTSSSNRGCEAAQLQDTAGSNSNAGSAVEFDKVYANLDSNNNIQGAADAVSFDSDGFTLNQTTADPQQNFLGFFALAGPGPTNILHSADCYVLEFRTQHSVDCFVPTNISHNVDVYVLEFRVRHSVDCYIPTTQVIHNADVYVKFFQNKLFVRAACNILFAINPNAYVKAACTLLNPNRQFVNAACTIVSKPSPAFVNAGVKLQVKIRNFVRAAVTLSSDKLRSYSVDTNVASRPAIDPLAFVKAACTLVAAVNKGFCGGYPDAAYVKASCWIVNPGGTDSLQMPGQGYSRLDDWLSSNDALAAYKSGSRFTFTGPTLPPQGISIIVTAFTANVISSQTRTRTWFRRVDAAPNGILITQEVSTHTLPNGEVVTTTTTKTQNQDILTTTVVIQDSGTPNRTSVIVTEKNSSGQTITRETETNVINGVVNSQEKKTVTSQPPTTENIQPLQVRTLDGVIHYQFFVNVNNEWAGGDAEGLTTTNKSEKVIPGTLNGQTTDSFGNPIYNKVTDETVFDPTGKVITTHTEEIGTRKDIGTITTDTTQSFQGLKKTTTTTINNPDGSQTIKTLVSNPISGDSIETTTETVTDEFGQVTTTSTNLETKNFTDPVTGQVRQTITKNVSVTKGGVTTTDNTVVTNNDFEDDIINQKVKVYFIQELTITCVIDEFSMEALAEVNMTHQKNYALLELFGQQLGNGNLSYGLRQKLIKQFNQANACIIPVNLRALGRNYSVVFAQSASAFRAKYIVGAEPHVFELQLILQARSDLVNGTFGF